jgi:cytochrome c peroxidase
MGRHWQRTARVIMMALLLVGWCSGSLYAQEASTPAAPAAVAPAPAKPKREVLKSGTYTMELPLGLQADAAYIPETNLLSAEKIELGKLLYYDPRLSKDSSIACASCHNPFHGFADSQRVSRGVGNQPGGRNSPTVINRLFSAEQFWDGRAADLEAQALGPLTNPVEMAMPAHTDVEKQVKAIKGYAPLFKRAFGTEEINIARITQAIASFERTVLSGGSPWDRYMAGDKDALSAEAVRGMAVFEGKGNCRVCHAGFNFTDESYHNLGVGMDKPKPDLGRYDVTKNESEKGAFKTPTLRNIELTAPYMHDGSESTLVEVVEFYNKGGLKNPQLSKEIKPLGLSRQEIGDLVAFLSALTGPVTNSELPASFPQ